MINMQAEIIENRLVRLVDKVSRATSDKFHSLSFESCIIIDTILSGRHHDKVIDFLQKTNDIRTAMIFDLINRTDKLDTGATLEERVLYAAAMLNIKGEPANETRLDINSEAAKAIVLAIVETVSRADSKIVHEITGDSPVETAQEAEGLAFAGAMMEHVREKYNYADYERAKEIILDALNIAAIDKIFRKFKDTNTLRDYYFEKTKEDETDEVWHGLARLQEEDETLDLALFSALEAAHLNNGADKKYNKHLLELAKTQAHDVALMRRLCNDATVKLRQPEVLFELSNIIPTPDNKDRDAVIAMVRAAAELAEQKKIAPDLISSYYIKLGKHCINRSDSAGSSKALAKAVKHTSKAVGEAFGLAQNAGVTPDFIAAMAEQDLSIDKAINACPIHIQTDIIQKNIGVPQIFNYFISNLPTNENLKIILFGLHKFDVGITAGQAETLGDKLLTEFHRGDLAAHWYGLAVKLAPNGTRHLKKYEAEPSAKDSFDSLTEAIGLLSKEKDITQYASALDRAHSEIAARKFAEASIENVFAKIGGDSTRPQDRAFCVRLAEAASNNSSKSLCYEKYNELLDDSTLRQLPWDKVKVIGVADILSNKNAAAAIRFLDEQLRRTPGAFAPSLRKGNLLFSRDKKAESLEILLASIETLSKAKDGSLEAVAGIYRTTIEEWVKNGMPPDSIKKYIKLCKEISFNNAVQWNKLGETLFKYVHSDLSADCFEQAFSTSNNYDFALRAATILFSTNKKTEGFNVACSGMRRLLAKNVLGAEGSHAVYCSYDNSVNAWIGLGLSKECVQIHIDFTKEHNFYGPEQWAAFGRVLAKQPELRSKVTDCFSIAYDNSKDVAYLVQAVKAIDAFDRNEALRRCILIRNETRHDAAREFIVQNVRTGLYDTHQLETLFAVMPGNLQQGIVSPDKYLQSLENGEENKLSISDSIEIINAAEKISSSHYAEFISAACEKISLLVDAPPRAGIYEKKSNAEYGLDKDKSLDSLLRAADIAYKYLYTIFDKYDAHAVSKKYEMLRPVLVKSKDAYLIKRFADLFNGVDPIKRLNCLELAHNYNKNPVWANDIAMMHERFGNSTVAMGYYQGAAHLTNNNSLVTGFSSRMLAKNNFLLALSGYEFVLGKQKSNAEANFGAGKCKVSLFQYEGALKYLEDYLALNDHKHKDEALYLKSVALKGIGRPEEALAAIANLVPHNRQFYAHKIDLQITLKYFEDAASTLEQLESNVPLLPNTIDTLRQGFRTTIAHGLALHAYELLREDSANYEQADRLAEKSAKLMDANNFLAHYVLGLCSEVGKHYSYAITHFMRAQQHDEANLAHTAAKRCALKFYEYAREDLRGNVYRKTVEDMLSGCYDSRLGRGGAAQI